MITHAPGPDDQLSIVELSLDTLNVMASRTEASNTLEQIIYRETELDEVWRLADIAVCEAQALGLAGEDAADKWITVRDLVHLAHDLIGHDEDTIAAAAALRKAGRLMSDGTT